eukprot:m.192008 g.192008  ORF g.192008 m.192008 type:complete len:150 (-) comp16762_c10_seq8:2461-2910(-)
MVLLTQKVFNIGLNLLLRVCYGKHGASAAPLKVLPKKNQKKATLVILQKKALPFFSRNTNASLQPSFQLYTNKFVSHFFSKKKFACSFFGGLIFYQTHTMFALCFVFTISQQLLMEILMHAPMHLLRMTKPATFVARQVTLQHIARVPP